MIDTEEIEGTAAVADLDAEIVTAEGQRPVCNAVGIDLAAKNANGRRKLYMRRDRNGRSLLEDRLGRKSGGCSSKEADDAEESELHFGSW